MQLKSLELLAVVWTETLITNYNTNADMTMYLNDLLGFHFAFHSVVMSGMTAMFAWNDTGAFPI